jgi:hypothetical protein
LYALTDSSNSSSTWSSSSAISDCDILSIAYYENKSKLGPPPSFPMHSIVSYQFPSGCIFFVVFRKVDILCLLDAFLCLCAYLEMRNVSTFHVNHCQFFLSYLFLFFSAGKLLLVQ